MKHIFIKQRGKYINLYLDNILFISSNGDNCVIECIDFKSYIIKATMKSLELKLLNYNFIRIHNKYIVNMNFIKSIEDSSIYLNNGRYILISQDRMKLIKERIVLL